MIRTIIGILIVLGLLALIFGCLGNLFVGIWGLFTGHPFMFLLTLVVLISLGFIKKSE